jgi:selenocysteine lyase/cysteine desulfurase
VVAFPVAANAVGTLVDVHQIVELAHEVDALAWADAVHYAPHGPIDVATWGVDVLTCSPYKFFGPHLGVAFVKQDLLESWRPYKVRPVPDDPLGRRYELGTAQHELLAGFVAAVVAGARRASLPGPQPDPGGASWPPCPRPQLSPPSSRCSPSRSGLPWLGSWPGTAA